MRIKEIKGQHRRDFRAVYICGHCGDENTGQGYDDAHFHNNVIPDMICRCCGKREGESYQPRTPKYPEGMTV